MSDVPDMLAGVTATPEDGEAQLRQIGKGTDSRLGGTCKICQRAVAVGARIANCARYGWCHASCLRDAQAQESPPG